MFTKKIALMLIASASSCFGMQQDKSELKRLAQETVQSFYQTDQTHSDYKIARRNALNFMKKSCTDYAKVSEDALTGILNPSEKTEIEIELNKDFYCSEAYQNINRYLTLSESLLITARERCFRNGFHTYKSTCNKSFFEALKEFSHECAAVAEQELSQKAAPNAEELGICLAHGEDTTNLWQEILKNEKK